MSKKEWLHLVVLFTAMAGLLFGYQQLQWKTVEVDLGYGEEARGNPYLAAEKFLDLKGIDVAVFKGLTRLDQLPPTDTVLILASAHRSMSQRRINDLLGWVRAGGRLVTSAPHPYNDFVGGSGDRLLDPLKIRLVSNYEPPLIEDDGGESAEEGFVDEASGVEVNTEPVAEPLAGDGSEASGDTAVQCGANSMPIFFDDDRYETWVNINSDFDIHYAGDTGDVIAAVTGRTGYQFLQVGLGDGIVSVFPHLDFWLNQNIGAHDHAYLLYQLAGNKVWLLYDKQMPSVLVLLWRVAPFLIAGLFLALFLWCWRKASRFGGLVDYNEPSRRQLLEHLLASAHLIWKRGDRRNLLRPLQDEIEALLRSNGDPRSEAEQRNEGLKFLALQTGIAVEQIELLLQCNEKTTEFLFVDKVQQLQKLRNAL